MSDSEASRQHSPVSWSNAEKCKVLQQTLLQAKAHRKQKKLGLSSQNATYCTLEEQKKKIFAHPLLPVIELLQEKCDEAVRTMEKRAFNIDCVVELIRGMERSNVRIDTGDKTLDELMYMAVIVIRTHLAELQKVDSLGDSFLEKYLVALKKLIAQEALANGGNESDEDGASFEVPTSENLQVHSGLATLTTPQGTVTIPLEIPSSSCETVAVEKSNFDFKSMERSRFPTSSSSQTMKYFMQQPFSDKIQHIEDQPSATTRNT